jgi:TorA maturation chaperone TorD
MNWVAAKLLSIWWSSPEVSLVDFFSNEWWESVLEMWRELSLPEIEIIESLWRSAVSEGKDEIGQEYERLFVGPALVPCPPYEAMWQSDRPRHEQGMTTGEVTLSVGRLYADFGFCVKGDCNEFPDHVAIELEALAHVWQTDGGLSAAEVLSRDHLAKWLPQFCKTVADESRVNFYRILATLTTNLAGRFASDTAGVNG